MSKLKALHSQKKITTIFKLIFFQRETNQKLLTSVFILYYNPCHVSILMNSIATCLNLNNYYHLAPLLLRH